MSHPEGYSEPKNANDLNQGFNYVYQYKDHLGNVRLSYTQNNSSIEIVEENNYYPFGLKHKGYNNNVSPLGNSVAKKFMFGGKEYQDELGLGWYDVTARNYDPALGRWMNLDPLAEQMRRHSPYNYAFDNPVFFIDPDGMAPRTIYDLDGNAHKINDDDVVEIYNSESENDSAVPPTDFINEKGEVIASTDDGSDDVYLIKSDRLDKFVANLMNNIGLDKDGDKSENKILGERYGSGQKFDFTDFNNCSFCVPLVDPDSAEELKEKKWYEYIKMGPISNEDVANEVGPLLSHPIHKNEEQFWMISPSSIKKSKESSISTLRGNTSLFLSNISNE